MPQHQVSALRIGRQALKDWLIPVLAGAAAGLSLTPLGLPPLLWLALAPLWSFGPCQAALWGGVAVLLSHGWLLWLHPLTWLGVPAPLSLPLVLMILLVCSGLGAGLVALWSVVLQRLDRRRWDTALLGAGLWALAEQGLATGPLFWVGLAVAPLPHDRPLAGLAALGGGGLVTLVQLVLSWLLARRQWVALLVVLLLGHGLGAAALARADGADPGVPLQVLAVQPAQATRHKFDADSQRRLQALLQRAGRRAAALQPSPPLLLPEGTLLLDGRPAREPAVPLLGGGFRRQGDGERSSVLWLPAGAEQARSWVDKHRLVPLGEWVPLADRIPWEGLSAVGGLQPGAADRRLPLPLPAGDAAVAICYELADGRALARAVADGAGWLLAVANLDPYPPLLQHQFLNLARLRAIETGRWLVSVANTGPTAVVDPAGRVVQRLPPGGTQLGLLELRGRRSQNVYERWGDGPLLLVTVGVAALASRQVR